MSTNETDRNLAEGMNIAYDLANGTDYAKWASYYAKHLIDQKNAIVNLIANGNFANGTTGWDMSSSGTVSNGELVVTNSVHESVTGASQSVNILINDIYYVRGMIKGAQNVAGLQLYGINGDLNKVLRVETDNVYSVISYITQAPSTETMSINCGFWDASLPATAYYKNILFIDLTAAFGAGNEPSQAYMDALLARLFPSTDGWFDGTDTTVIDSAYADGKYVPYGSFNGTSSASIAAGATSSVGTSGQTYNSMTALGAYSQATVSGATAIGVNAKATNTGATAVGAGATAAAGGGSSGSSAFGYGASALASVYGEQTAVGGGSKAGDSYATALGSVSTASGYESVSMGARSVASGMHASAVGDFTTASDSYALATGNRAQATGRYTVALGAQSSASGTVASAIGSLASASGTGAVSIGENSFAKATGSIALGWNSWSVVENWFTTDGGAGNGTYYNRTHSLYSTDYVFFRNANVDSTLTAQSAYTAGYTLTDALEGNSLLLNGTAELTTRDEKAVLTNLLSNGNFANGTTGWNRSHRLRILRTFRRGQ
jgi:hypothetical protein